MAVTEWQLGTPRFNVKARAGHKIWSALFRAFELSTFNFELGLVPGVVAEDGHAVFIEQQYVIGIHPVTHFHAR